MKRDPIYFAHICKILNDEMDKKFVKELVRLFKQYGMSCELTHVSADDDNNDMSFKIDGVAMKVYDNRSKMCFRGISYIVKHLPELNILSEEELQDLFLDKTAYFRSVDDVYSYFKKKGIDKLIKPKLRPMGKLGMLEAIKPEDFEGLPDATFDRTAEYKTDFHAIYVDSKKLITPIFLKQVQSEFKEMGVDFQIDYNYNDTVEDVRVYVDKIPMRMLDHRRLSFCNLSEIIAAVPEIQAVPDYKNIFAGKAPAHFYDARELAEYFETKKIKEMLKPKLRNPAKLGVFENLKTFNDFLI